MNWYNSYSNNRIFWNWGHNFLYKNREECLNRQCASNGEWREDIGASGETFIAAVI